MVHRSGTQLEELSTPAGTAVRKDRYPGGSIWLPNLDGFIYILSSSEESVCRCSWAKCVYRKLGRSSGGAQTGSKWWIDIQSASVVSRYLEE